MMLEGTEVLFSMWRSACGDCFLLHLCACIHTSQAELFLHLRAIFVLEMEHLEEEIQECLLLRNIIPTLIRLSQRYP